MQFEIWKGFPKSENIIDENGESFNTVNGIRVHAIAGFWTDELVHELVSIP